MTEWYDGDIDYKRQDREVAMKYYDVAQHVLSEFEEYVYRDRVPGYWKDGLGPRRQARKAIKKHFPYWYDCPGSYFEIVVSVVELRFRQFRKERRKRAADAARRQRAAKPA